MRRSTKELALCSMMAALGIVLLCVGGIVPFAVYACPILASGTLLPVREECRPGYAWCCWAATAILALLLGPDKEAAALYLFLGYYPLLQPRLEKIHRAALRWLAKLTVASAAICVMYALLLYVFCLTEVVETFSETAPWLLWLTVALGLAVFVVYDILLRRFSILWERRKKR